MIAAALLKLLFAGSSLAACTSPAGQAGQFQFITPDYKYCDGTNWQSLAVGTPSGTCSTAGLISVSGTDVRFCNGTNFVSMDGSETNGTCAAGSAGTIRYSSANAWMEWCNGTNWKVMRAGFPAPTIASLSAIGASDDGGITTSITGTGFRTGAVAKVNGVNCTTSTFVSATRVDCLVPPGVGMAIVKVNVSVTNTDNQTATLANSFYYVGDPQLWVRADAGVTLTSGKVSGWTDQSGNSFTINQPTASLRPTVVNSATFGGKPVMNFNGSTFLDMGSAASLMRNASAISVVLAAKRVATGQGVIMGFQNTANNELRLAVGVGSHWADANVGSSGTGNFFVMGRRLEADALHALTVPSGAINLPLIGSAVINYNTRAASFTLNGSTSSTSSTFSSGGGATTNADSVNASLGADDGFDYFTGELPELFLYRQELTPTQRGLLEEYLRARYSLP